MKFLIYARVSPRGSDFEGETSIQMQIEYCRSLIAKKGDDNTIVGELYDEFISGKDLDRPAIKQILTDLESGNADWDCLCVYNLSRLTRNPRDMYAVMDALTAHKKVFLSACEPEFDFTTLAGEMLMGVISHVNQYIRKISGKNTKDKMVSIAKAGYWPVGCTPFGYKRGAKRDNLLYVDERKAPIVKDMFEMYASEKYTTRDIVSKYRGTLTKVRILALLRNPVYLGKIPYDGKIYDGAHKAIISLDLFNRVQRKLPMPKEHMRPKAYKYPFILPGLLRCHCGRYLTPGTAKSGEYAYYTCTDADCKTRISAPQLEQKVLSIISAIYIDQKILRATVEEIKKMGREQYLEAMPELCNLQKARNGILDEKERIFNILLQSEINESIKKMANEKISKLDSELQTIDLQIEKIQALDNDEGRLYEAAANFIENIKRFQGKLAQAADPDAKRQILRLYIHHIEFDKEKKFRIIYNKNLVGSTNGNEWWA